MGVPTKAEADKKYIICNADEGDPGAYMNRNEIESDPHSLIEGMIIGAYAMGASEGIIYIRRRVPPGRPPHHAAIEQAREYGSGREHPWPRLQLRFHVVEGAGAFVCGEETSLISSLEGRAGPPHAAPALSGQEGLYGRPTSINNVETWYNIAPIVSKGAAWFTETGSVKSPGTKGLLAGRQGPQHGPGGMRWDAAEDLRHDIGGAAPTAAILRPWQTRRPLRRLHPDGDVRHPPVDYETLAQLGSIMGSAAWSFMDEDNCMVGRGPLLHRVHPFESCGKCVPCRVGLDKALGC